MQERVVEINRVAKVVKGGRRFSFTALVVVGDEKSQVGVGYGKANEVPVAIQKGVERARKDLFEVPMHGSTITHEAIGVTRRSRVLLKPASAGTGVIAGGGVRAVLELAGIKDVLSKCLGSQNPINLVKATVVALQRPARPEGGRQAARADRARGARHRRRAQTRRPRSAAEPTRAAPRGGARRDGQAHDHPGQVLERREPQAARDAAHARTRQSARASSAPTTRRPRQLSTGRPSGGGTMPDEDIGLHSLKPAPGSRHRASASAAARARARQDLRPRPEGLRRALGLEDARSASRAARCRSTCGCASCAART